MSARVLYYPLFVDLRGRRCVVIGGGLIAQRKVTTLLRFGAAITLVSPTVTKRLARYAQQGVVRHVVRRFRPGDLKGAWLVYAATDDQQINEQVFREASAAQIFTNVVDQKPLCSFIAPAIVKRGELVIAISTGGASPTVAKRLRRELQQTIGADYGSFLKLLGSLRDVAKRMLPSYDDRKHYFDALASGRVFSLVRAGKTSTARAQALRLLQDAARNPRV